MKKISKKLANEVALFKREVSIKSTRDSICGSGGGGGCGGGCGGWYMPNTNKTLSTYAKQSSTKKRHTN